MMRHLSQCEALASGRRCKLGGYPTEDGVRCWHHGGEKPEPKPKRPKLTRSVKPRQEARQCEGRNQRGERCGHAGREVVADGEVIVLCAWHGGPNGRRVRGIRRGADGMPPRPRTEDLRHLRSLARLPSIDTYPDVERPKTRGDCEGGPRPCPFVSCRYHLYLDVLDTGSLKINRPDLEPWELEDSCALDVADRAGITLEEAGEVMNLTRERIRQLESIGLRKLKTLGLRVAGGGRLLRDLRGAA